MVKTNINYKNFFQWYKEECKAWNKEHPNDMYSPGISEELFIYFIILYLYKGDKYVNDVEKLIYILNKHSKRYKKEKFYLKFHKNYRDKNWADCGYVKNVSEFNLNSYTSLPSDIYVSICKEYLSKPHYYVDSIGCSQVNLDYLYGILEDHSFKFKVEKYLYKLFKNE